MDAHVTRGGMDGTAGRNAANPRNGDAGTGRRSVIRVLVLGAAGRMGRAVLEAVNEQTDMEIVGGVDVVRTDAVSPLFSRTSEAVRETSPDVSVDFSIAAAAASNALSILDAHVSPVIGTTGMSTQQIAAIRERAGSVGAFIAPNFAVGAVLMMEMAKLVAPHLDHAEIVELHHDRKVDAPSGTAARTAELIVTARDGRSVTDAITDKFTVDGVRGGVVGGVRIHSIRLPGLVAHQEVIFGGTGQTLSIRHDSTSRESFMPGVLLAVRQVRALPGLVVGLEHLLFTSEGKDN